MKISDKRIAGAILGRGGISQRIIQIAQDIADGSYKNAIEKAGQISVLVDAATYDEYWKEKSYIGIHRESDILCGLINGDINKDKAICLVDPYSKD